MSYDVKVKLEARKKALQDEFQNLSNEREKIIEQAKVCQQRLNEIQARQLEVRGGFAEVESLMDNPGKPIPIEGDEDGEQVSVKEVPAEENK